MIPASVHTAQIQLLCNQPQYSFAGSLPALTAAPNVGANLDSSSEARLGHGLSQGAIAGIVLGSIAAAVLITILIAVIVIKVDLPAVELYQCMYCSP